MKKALYIPLVLLAAGVFASCNGTKDYDAYIERLQAEEAAIEKISTPAEYAAFVENYVQMTDSFAGLGIKLDETQTDEIKQLNMSISERVNAKYFELINKSATIQVDSVAAPAPADSIPAN